MCNLPTSIYRAGQAEIMNRVHLPTSSSSSVRGKVLAHANCDCAQETMFRVIRYPTLVIA